MRFYDAPFLGQIGIKVGGQALCIPGDLDEDAAYGQWLFSNVLALCETLKNLEDGGHATIDLVDEPVSLRLSRQGGRVVAAFCLGEKADEPKGLSLKDFKEALATAVQDYLEELAALHPSLAKAEEIKRLDECARQLMP